MPIPFVADLAFRGIGIVPYAFQILRILPIFVLVGILKLYLNGGTNSSERLLRSKVILISGGTSGVGAAITKDLATRGAQIILLTQHKLTDPFLVDYLEDLRSSTNNECIYAEEVNLASLLSIRSFATRWIDNSPPRRLDMIILCADSLTPRFGLHEMTQDRISSVWGTNYLANFHLLNIMSPAIRAQPPDRDVRIIMATCSTYVGGILPTMKAEDQTVPQQRPYETSKLACMVFAQIFQRKLNDYSRPDKQSNNARMVLVDPGFTRTPGMRRWLSMGTLWGLLLYLITWPFWWIVLKSSRQGAQSFLYAAMDAGLESQKGGCLIKDCKEIPMTKPEVYDTEIQNRLWQYSEQQIQQLEKESAAQRAKAKKA